MLGRQHHLQGLPEQVVEMFGLRQHQLPLPEPALLPGPHQLAVIQKPDAAIGRWMVPLETGQSQARVGPPQPGQLYLQQALAGAIANHQGQGAFTQGQGHQQADPPAGIAARGKPHKGVVATAQAAGHQATEAQVVGPGFAPFPCKQGLELVVGAGFEHSQAANRIGS